MTRNSIARLAGFSAGAAMVLGFAAPVGAQTIAELQAQIAALMAQLSAMSGGASASSAITSDLTVGSTGSQVVALQNSLVSGGYLMMPAGVAPGYFGSLTKSAVAKWQAAVGLPATGYFGPLSRAKFGGSVAGGTTTGGTTTGGTVSGTITTPGVEGTLTVTSAPASNSTFYEGQDMVTVLAFKAEADLSDIALQRVKLDLDGTDNTLYRDLLSKVYLVDDAGKTLASADLNSSTVVRNGSNRYELTLTGFSSVVAKDATRTYTIKADVQSTIDSTDISNSPYTIALAANGVRGIDGAGIDLYSPDLVTDVTKNLTFAASLVDSASLTVSANSSNPASREIVAAEGSSDNEADKVVLMVFDIRAEKDAIEITDLENFVVSRTNGAATASTTYLYAGNGTGGQLLGSDSSSDSDVDFTDINYTIPAGATRTFTLAADVRSASGVQTTLDASFTGNSSNVIAENSLGDTVTSVSGSADANNVLVRNVGPVFSLVSAPTVTSTDVGFAGATSSAKATFKVRMQAVGTDVDFGSNSSTTYPVAGWGSAAAARSFVIYLNGAAVNPSVASSTTVTLDTSKVSTVSGLDSYRLSEGNEVDLTIEFVMFGRTSAGAEITAGAYAFGLERINWLSTETGRAASTFMSGETAWRTPSITLP